MGFSDEHPLCRHSREGGNPAQSKEKLGPRFRAPIEVLLRWDPRGGDEEIDAREGRILAPQAGAKRGHASAASDAVAIRRARGQLAFLVSARSIGRNRTGADGAAARL